MKTYKVSCEFYVKAKDKEQATEGLSWETDFFKNHVIVEPSELPENEEIWEDYASEEIVKKE